MPIPSGLKMPIERFPWASLCLGLGMAIAYGVAGRFKELSTELIDRFGLTLQTLSVDALMGHAFLHRNLIDLLVSLFLLGIIGSAVENRAGWHRFLALFAVGIVANAGLHLALSPLLTPSYPFLGSSGGLLALIGAGVICFPHARTVYRFRSRRMWGYTWHEFELPFIAAGPLCLLVDIIVGAGQAGVMTPLVLARLGSFVAGAALAPVLGVPRDSAEASAAAALLTETGDYRTLSKLELFALAENQTDNPHLTLALLDRLTKDRLQPNPDLMLRFAQQIPLFEKEEGLALSAAALLSVHQSSMGLTMEQALRVTQGAAQHGGEDVARGLYSWILHSSQSDDDEKETAAFRLADLLSKSGQTKEAQALYIWLVQTYPFGSLTSASQSRIDEIEGRK